MISTAEAAAAIADAVELAELPLRIPVGDFAKQLLSGKEQNNADMNGPTYFIVTQSPGPKWVPGVAYNEQPEFGVHVGYLEEIFARGLMVLSGPFMQSAGGALADGGMTILKDVTPEKATAIAEQDPTVKSGMLTVDVKPWWIPFHH